MPGGLNPRPYPVNPGAPTGPHSYFPRSLPHIPDGSPRIPFPINPPLSRINPPLPKINPPGPTRKRPPNPRWYAEDVPDLMDEEGNRFMPWEVKSQKKMDLEHERFMREKNQRKLEDFFRRQVLGKRQQREI
jgi:hypothetical protein